jgi:hypothetical protein
MKIGAQLEIIVEQNKVLEFALVPSRNAPQVEHIYKPGRRPHHRYGSESSSTTCSHWIQTKLQEEIKMFAIFAISAVAAVVPYTRFAFPKHTIR